MKSSEYKSEEPLTQQFWLTSYIDLPGCFFLADLRSVVTLLEVELLERIAL